MSTTDETTNKANDAVGAVKRSAKAVSPMDNLIRGTFDAMFSTPLCIHGNRLGTGCPKCKKMSDKLIAKEKRA